MSVHSTSLHFTIFHLFTLSPHLKSLPSNYIQNPLSKLFSLQGKDASKPAGNWFQFLMDCVAHWRISMRFRYNGGLVNGELYRMVCPGCTVDTCHVDAEQTADWLFNVGVGKAPRFDSHEFLKLASEIVVKVSDVSHTVAPPHSLALYHLPRVHRFE